MNMNLKKVLSLVAALAMSTSCFTALAEEAAEATEAADATEATEVVEATEAVEEIAETEEVAATEFKGITDISDSAYKTAIEELVALGVVNGYEDGSFKPDNNITRAEVTKLVVSAMGPSYSSAAESAKGNTGFSDSDSHWASGYIATGVAQAFINGYPEDGTFRPDNNVKYAEIVKMLAAVLGYTPAAEANGGYPNGFIQTANSIGLTEGVSGVSAETAVTRGQVAQLIANAVDTPIVAVTSWTTDIYGKPVAETEIKDGKGDSKEYWTLLTENHDVYKVRGRVINTHAQGNVEKDEVEFQIEYSDNYDDEQYNLRTDDTSTTEIVLYGNTNAPELLFTYAEALIKLNEDDEAELLSITPYGKNDIVELAADDFDSFDYDNEKTIDFTISSTSSKTKTYKLNDQEGAKAYVNGVEVDLADAVADYIDGNTIGKVTLIDTPMGGSSSKDGKYDFIMIDYKMWAVVESTTSSSTTDKIYFSDFENGMPANITIDKDDEEFLVTYVEDGAEVDFDAVKEDSVVLVTYDVTGSLKDSNFLKFEIKNEIIEGQVASKSKEDGKNIYVIDGTEYKSCADETQGELTVGNEYALFIDAAGRIVKYDETASSKNFAIIDRVYYDNNSGEYKVRIIKADGTRNAYIAKDDATKKAAAEIAYGENVVDGTLTAIEDRIISYKLNSSDEIHTIYNKDADGQNGFAVTRESDEYNENGLKVSSAKMNDATQIVDLTDLFTTVDDELVMSTSYSVTDIKAGSLASFIDGEEYTVIAADKNTDGYYKFVVIIDGNASIGVTTGFAVIDSVSTATYEADGSTRTTITVFSADSKGDKVELFLDEDIDNEDDIKELKRGDVVVYGLDGDGVVTELNILMDEIVAEDAAMSYENALAINAQASIEDPKGKLAEDYYLESGVAKWDNSTLATSNGYARVGFGAIVDKKGSTLTIATINKDEDVVDANGVEIPAGNIYSAYEDMGEFSLASDVNVYVYDYNYKNSATSGRLSAGSAGSIVKTNVSKTLLEEDADGNYVYNWTEIAEDGMNAHFAYFKVVDGDITDILVICPKD